MTMDLSFAPVLGRADALNRRMYRELAASLRYVAETSRDVISFDELGLEARCARLDGGEFHPPVLFAYYYALVMAFEGGDRQSATDLFAKLIALSPMPHPQIVALGTELGDECSALYPRMVEADESWIMDIAAPSRADADRFRADFAEAMALIDAAAPLLAEEIRGLARQIILVGQGARAETEFDGGSHFQLWNALFLNIDRPRSRVTLAEVIAHECAHSLLFGFCTDEPLVLNDDEERYASPLRYDPRPMDGIYHATFVSARMCWLLEQLMASGLLSADEMIEAVKSSEKDRLNFADGDRVIAEHGLLTETGRAAIDGARRYMAAARTMSDDTDRVSETAQ